MRKPRKTVVAAVLLATVGFLGTGTAYAHGHGDGHKKQGHGHAREHHGQKSQKSEKSQTIVISQKTTCTTTEENVDVQGETGYENGREGNRSNGKGDPGTQTTNIGSSQGCNNTIVLGR